MTYNWRLESEYVHKPSYVVLTEEIESRVHLRIEYFVSGPIEQKALTLVLDEEDLEELLRDLRAGLNWLKEDERP